MPDGPLPPFPYGAVYFRKSNPPKADWDRDYATAAADGYTAFRHWFLWSSVEIEPGVWDWSDYDRHLDLAAKHGIKTIVAEMDMHAPEWAWRLYPHARYETRDGKKVESHMSGSCVTGGTPGLCLDNEDWRERAENFLRELVTRYKDHPGLGGYDIWNECNYAHDYCFCLATAEKFRAWLKERYPDLRALGAAWQRHSFADWLDVTPPRYLGPYPHVVDWLRFRQDDAYRLMRWRADFLQQLDPVHPVTAHGIASAINNFAPGGSDDWRAADIVTSYGYTWGSSRHGDEPWKQFHAVDLVRAACRGKRFWHAEAYAGPLWMASNVLNKPRDEGRIAGPDDVRYWDMASFMLGATGLFYLRWRPLLDGPLFGAFGPYGLDGSRTPRSEAASRVGKWVAAPEQANLWKSRPVKGEIGIVFVPEAQVFAYAQQSSTEYFADSLRGAYQGFFANNIQSDWVHIDHVDDYDTLYLPFPYALSDATIKRLTDWVARGGVLLSEGCPGYFDERGHVHPPQLSRGLAELFGARETYVEFTPDILGDLKLMVDGAPTYGGLFLQCYESTTGTAVGWYGDGRVAAVDNAFGKGRTRLVGTMVGRGFGAHPDHTAARFFADALAWAGKSQHARTSDPRIKARIHAGDGGTYLWIANSTRQPVPVRIELGPAWGPFHTARSLHGADAAIDGRLVTMTAGARDVAVLALA